MKEGGGERKRSQEECPIACITETDWITCPTQEWRRRYLNHSGGTTLIPLEESRDRQESANMVTDPSCH